LNWSSWGARERISDQEDSEERNEKEKGKRKKWDHETKKIIITKKRGD